MQSGAESWEVTPSNISSNISEGTHIMHPAAYIVRRSGC